MENASKALIMAGGILLAIMVLSIGALMVNSGGLFSQSYSDRIEQDNINNFNQKILYYARNINAQDMVSLINLVKSINDRYDAMDNRDIEVRCDGTIVRVGRRR